MSSDQKSSPLATPRQLARAVGTSRRAAVLAAALVVAGLLLGVALDNGAAGGCAALGVVLGLVNTVLTELSMMRFVSTGEELSRKQFATSALVRLGAVSLVAFALVLLLWPAGGFVLVGLAVFHLLSVALTGLPLLKELRKA